MKKILLCFMLLGIPAAAEANVTVPAGTWTLIFDEEFNNTSGVVEDYTHLNSVWTASSGNTLRGGSNYCWSAHQVTLPASGHEVDLGTKTPCWVSGATQAGEGARIVTGSEDVQQQGTTFNCDNNGVISQNGIIHPGFCFAPISGSCGSCSSGVPEIYEEVLYDVPCDGTGHVYNHPVFWNVGNGPWPSTNEFDIMHPADMSPSNTTKMFSEMFYGTPKTPFVQGQPPLAACGWHVFAMHWVGQNGSTAPFVEFWVDGTNNGSITSNVTAAPQIAFIELAYDGTPPTVTTGNITGKAVYLHIAGKNVPYPAVTAQANYGGLGDTAGKTLGSP